MMATNKETLEAAERRIEKLIAMADKAELEAPGILNLLVKPLSFATKRAATGALTGLKIGSIGAIHGAVGGAVVGGIIGGVVGLGEGIYHNYQDEQKRQAKLIARQEAEDQER